ncbi:MAG: DUF6798 domain-containing protein [Candidatus Eisenbacteria bacterium]|nr:DUF6798 domain-containing protein [Candidatus Eisenbacteria bacterium]
MMENPIPPHSTRPGFTGSRASLIAGAILAGIAAYWLITLMGSFRDLPPCEIVCSGCDMALYQAHELMTREPDLFRRDRLFVVHHAIYPQAYSHAMNFLNDLTENRWTTIRIALGAMGFLFLAGCFLLNQRVIGNPIVAAMATLLAAFTRRGYPIWGLPSLKPNEIVGAASPLLLYLLYRGLSERWLIQIFTLLAAVLTYTHPPTGFLLLAIGAGTYAWLGRTGSHYREGLIHSALILPVVLFPLVLKHATMIQKAPSLEILLVRADLTFFPTRGTVLVAASTLLAPLLLALLIYPRIRQRLTAGARRFIETTVVLAMILSLASSITYVWPGLSRFALWFASRYAYFSIFAVIALGLWHWRDFGGGRGALIWLAAFALLLNLDTKAVNAMQALRHRAREGQAAAVPTGNDASTRCYLAEAGAWVQAHTARDDLILVPPHEANAGFRVLSRRAIVVSDKDGGACAYDGISGPEWLARMKDVEPAYRDGSRTALESVARKYEAQYILISRKADTPPEGSVFQNDYWIIWPTHIPVP